VRSDCGLFDLSHMGRVHLRGQAAMALAQECCTRNLERLRPGEAAYSVLCNAAGGILDDVIAYVMQPDEIVFVFNASNRVSDIAFFAEQRDRLRVDVRIEDRTFETALIGVQGPRSQQVVQAVCDIDLEQLGGYSFAAGKVVGKPAIVARTGYTGEDGFELVVAAEQAEDVWTRLEDHACPCGLGARDTLRTEAGFALYGHEIDTSTNPYEARLGWVVNLGKASFVGREALARLKSEGPSRRLVGLRVAIGAIPRPGARIQADGGPVGTVTSGTYSPTLKANIAMGYVPVALAEAGQALSVELRGKSSTAEVVSLPFVPHRSRSRAKM
jgi:aminomethyltransferase